MEDVGRWDSPRHVQAYSNSDKALVRVKSLQPKTLFVQNPKPIGCPVHPRKWLHPPTSKMNTSCYSWLLCRIVPPSLLQSFRFGTRQVWRFGPSATWNFHSFTLMKEGQLKVPLCNSIGIQVHTVPSLRILWWLRYVIPWWVRVSPPRYEKVVEHVWAKDNLWRWWTHWCLQEGIIWRHGSTWHVMCDVCFALDEV